MRYFVVYTGIHRQTLWYADRPGTTFHNPWTPHAKGAHAFESRETATQWIVDRFDGATDDVICRALDEAELAMLLLEQLP